MPQISGVLSGTNGCASYFDSFTSIIIPISGVWFLDKDYFPWSLNGDNGDDCAFYCKEWGFVPIPVGSVINSARVNFLDFSAVIPDGMKCYLNIGYNVDPSTGNVNNSITGDIGPLTFDVSDTPGTSSCTWPITKPQSDSIIAHMLLSSFGFLLQLHGNFDNDLLVNQITFDLLYDPPTVPSWSQKSYRLNRNRPFTKVR